MGTAFEMDYFLQIKYIIIKINNKKTIHTLAFQKIKFPTYPLEVYE